MAEVVVGEERTRGISRERSPGIITTIRVNNNNNCTGERLGMRGEVVGTEIITRMAVVITRTGRIRCGHITISSSSIRVVDQAVITIITITSTRRHRRPMEGVRMEVEEVEVVITPEVVLIVTMTGVEDTIDPCIITIIIITTMDPEEEEEEVVMTIITIIICLKEEIITTT